MKKFVYLRTLKIFNVLLISSLILLIIFIVLRHQEVGDSSHNLTAVVKLINMEEFPSDYVKGWVRCERDFPRLRINKMEIDLHDRKDVNWPFSKGFMIFGRHDGDLTLSLYCSSVLVEQLTFRQVVSVRKFHSLPGLNELIKSREPLNIKIVPMRNPTIHVLIPGLSKELTGGPLSILHFCCEMTKLGLSIDIIFLNEGELPIPEFKKWASAYDGLENIFSIDMKYSYNVVEVGLSDVFLATIYFTANTASSTQKLINEKPFIYFVQDYESGFFPWGSNWVDAELTYSLNYYPIYSTDSLASYFHEIRGDKRPSYTALPAIQEYNNVIGKHQKKLVFYGRPQADRNAFDLSLLVLYDLCKQGDLKGWEILSVGSPRGSSDFPLCDGLMIRVMSNVKESEYFSIISSSDVALSLMISPHPSLPPFDFVRLGVICVTNHMSTKNLGYFKSKSELFVSSELSLDSLIKNMKIAMELSKNLKLRNKQPRLLWPDKWSDDRCYGSKLKVELEQLLI